MSAALDAQAAAVAAEFARLPQAEQASIAGRSNVHSVDAMVDDEVRALAHAVSALHAARRAHAEKQRALANKAEAAGALLASHLRYVLAVCIQLVIKQRAIKRRSWRPALEDEGLSQTASLLGIFAHPTRPTSSELTQFASEWRAIICALRESVEGTALLAYLLENGSRVPENSLRKGLKKLTVGAARSEALITAALVLIEAYDKSTYKCGALIAFNEKLLALTAARDSPSPSGGECALAVRSPSLSESGARAEAAGAQPRSPGCANAGASSDPTDDDDDGRCAESDGALDQQLEQASARGGETLSDPSAAAAAGAGRSAFALVDTLRDGRCSISMRSADDARDLAGLVLDAVARSSSDDVLRAFVHEVHSQYAARRADQPQRPRRRPAASCRLSLTTVDNLPGRRGLAAASATPLDEVSALRERLAAAEAELALSAAAGRKRTHALASRTDGGNVLV